MLNFKNSFLLLVFNLVWSAPAAWAIQGGRVVDLNGDTEKRAVLLQTENTPHCTGVPLSARIILTAAHCLETSEILYVQRASESIERHNISSPRKIIAQSIQPGWPENSHHDLALAVLDQDLPSDTLFAEIRPDLFKRKQKDAKVLAAGFGRTSGRPTAPQDEGTLREVVLSVLDISKDQKLLLTDQYRGQGICSGDSGGPLFQQDQEGLRLVGISHEASSPRGDSEMMRDACLGIGKFTSTEYFRDWIQHEHQELLKHHGLRSGL